MSKDSIEAIDEISAGSELERTKRVGAVAYDPEITLLPNDYTIQATLSPSVAIEGAPIHSKPQLKPPIFYRLAEVATLREKVQRNDLERSKKIAEKSLSKIEELTLKESEDLEKYLNSNPHVLWNVLYHTASYTAAASALVLGATAIAAGSGGIVVSATLAGLANTLGISATTLYGHILLFSGVSNIANSVMKETGSWHWVAEKITSDKDLQKKIETYGQAALATVSVATGLFAGYASNVVSIVADWGVKVTDIASKTSNIAFGVSNIAIGKAEMEKLRHEAELILSRENKSSEHSNLLKTTKSIESVAREQKAFNNALANAMQSEEEMYRIISNNTAALAG